MDWLWSLLGEGREDGMKWKLLLCVCVVLLTTSSGQLNTLIC